MAQALRLVQEASGSDGERLEELARSLGLSRAHFQRSFLRWVGLSPKQFATFLHVTRAKGLLRASHAVLDTALTLGLSGPGRLHDQFIQVEAMTPGEYKRQGEGLTIAYGRGTTPLGVAVIAWTGRGICALSFLSAASAAIVSNAPASQPESDTEEDAHQLQAAWPRALLVRRQAQATRLLQTVFTPEAGRAASATASPLRLLVGGTAFQIAVWRALLAIPPGAVLSYGRLAAWCGHPRAARAVGSAIAANPLAFLIPCHRVIRDSGLIGGYRWNPDRKLALLAREIHGQASSARSRTSAAR
jgi:AraC family transcriptional regulator of adaptative response/methylated-DNA-[protein]-cysteine methyltransferase